ncbi:helix-turn-helix domain-containing protein [Mesorhizobium sp. LHD-90]|uniref:helix-turn-helix domain-containing protein n=1 Tax=Mesorhizobium sp. LHD-90 TaxID=3071414 RepID=UPI0027E1245D|nr:helix-turn-helix domain-containing protein [Mesorhizobium sp. LHD-90]MDQ6436854.1 helix-turn-helix domain-containing protein [Mesorhizobium sp. LHD-90]
MQVQTALAMKPMKAAPPARVRDEPLDRGKRGERTMEICEAMIDICAALYNVPSKEMRQTGRCEADVARVRQIAMYVTHVSLGVSMHEVGRGFVRDRTTVRHACHLIEDMREDEDFDRAIATTEKVALAAFRGRLEV